MSEGVAIMEIFREYGFMAPYATMIGVMIALWQLWRNAEQQKTNFEDSLSKEYRDIIQKIPYKALLGCSLEQQEKEAAYNELFNYMDLCNEQAFLRASGRIRKKTWENWRRGMLTNFSHELFREFSDEVFEKIEGNFSELKRVRNSGYKEDPKKWKLKSTD